MLIFLQRNLVWMLLALVLSSALWTMVTTQQNPDTVDRFDGIPVELRNVPDGLAARNDVESVTLTVSAPRDAWPELRSAKLQAWVDLSRIGPAQQPTLQEIPILANSVDSRVTIVDVTPSKANVHLEPILQTRVPVRAKIVGEVPAGYLNRAPKLAPEMVTVTGPQSLVEQVVAAVAEVNLNGVTGSINQVYRVQPQLANGERVERVGVTPENVAIEVPVEQERAFKSVPVTTQLTGTVTPGYQVIGLRVEPSTVIIEGPPRTVESTSFVATQLVNVNGASADLSVNADLQMPADVRLAREQPVVVRVFVSPVEGSKIIEVAPQVQNVGDGLRASITPGSVKVTVHGPMPVLSTLGPRDAKITLDAGGLPPGTHLLRPRIDVPALVRLQGTEPDQVEVRINLVS